MHAVDQFSFKVNVISNGFKKYMSFNIGNKLIFIDSFQFLPSSIDSLIKSLGKDDFKYLSQKFYRNVLHLVKQKGWYPYTYVSDFEKFKEELQNYCNGTRIHTTWLVNKH